MNSGINLLCLERVFWIQIRRNSATTFPTLSGKLDFVMSTNFEISFDSVFSSQENQAIYLLLNPTDLSNLFVFFFFLTVATRAAGTAAPTNPSEDDLGQMQDDNVFLSIWSLRHMVEWEFLDVDCLLTEPKDNTNITHWMEGQDSRRKGYGNSNLADKKGQQQQQQQWLRTTMNPSRTTTATTDLLNPRRVSASGCTRSLLSRITG